MQSEREKSLQVRIMQSEREKALQVICSIANIWKWVAPACKSSRHATTWQLARCEKHNDLISHDLTRYKS